MVRVNFQSICNHGTMEPWTRTGDFFQPMFCTSCLLVSMLSLLFTRQSVLEKGLCLKCTFGDPFVAFATLEQAAKNLNLGLFSTHVLCFLSACSNVVIIVHLAEAVVEVFMPTMYIWWSFRGLCNHGTSCKEAKLGTFFNPFCFVLLVLFYLFQCRLYSSPGRVGLDRYICISK